MVDRPADRAPRAPLCPAGHLPHLGPTRGEIGRHPGFRQSPTLQMKQSATAATIMPRKRPSFFMRSGLPVDLRHNAS
ncbi:MAG: hypothetical protein E5W82_00090 [Mesorhizobium sp.]|nr:MAG: hypothetical protein E5W82_00090 [Mesorhizobium sp.]